MSRKRYYLQDLPTPLTSFTGVRSCTTAEKFELAVQVCLSCGHEYESDSVVTCPVCASKLTYSEDSFLPDTKKATFSIVGEATANPLDLGLVPTLLDKISSYSLPVRTAKERAVAKTNWQAPLFNVLRKHRDFAPAMLHSFISICDKRSYFEALQSVESASARLTELGHNATMAEGDIKDLAKEKAQQLTKQLATVDDDAERFRLAERSLSFLGLSFDAATVKRKQEAGELFSMVNRAADEYWLRRQLRRRFAQSVEHVARDLALVQKHKQVYCSDFSVNRYRARTEDNRAALENTVAYDEDDASNVFSLAELSDKSVSNVDNRNAEMFIRLKGFEAVSQSLGHSAIFTTVTAPSRFHSVANRVTNKKWLAAGKPTPVQANDYLVEVWTALRKSLDKKKIKIYGMRVVEPHHDGTPHHHQLIFGLPTDLAFVKKELKRLALLDSPNEKGAKEHRFKCEDIDPNYTKKDGSKGSAVGYIAKYISKSTDGKHIEKDLTTDADAAKSAERIVTWARIENIRQFQFFGGPSVTVWREMRRLKDEIQEGDAVFNNLEGTEHYLLEKVRKSADEGDWAAFCIAMGGVFVKRTDQTVRTHYAVPAVVEKLFESHEYATTRFGDKANARINGILFQGVFKATRFKNWVVMNKEAYIRGQKKVMSGVVDIFDVLEREKEYERMAEQQYQEYENHMFECEEMQALLFEASAWRGSEATDVMTHQPWTRTRVNKCRNWFF